MFVPGILWSHQQVAFESKTFGHPRFQTRERLSDLTGPYWGTYRIVYRVIQPLLEN